MSNIKEYIVTLRNFEDLELFYQDMETTGGNLYIPNRTVDVALRRPISKNTHYYLTDEEAAILKNDPRVLTVELTLADQEISITPSYIQSSLKWDKSSLETRNDHRNWGLYRCTLNSNIPNWGSDLITTQIGSIDIATSGKDVDVVICDGHIDVDHPEFAANSDGTGGTRVIQYNWSQHNPEVLGSAAGTYIYPPYVDPSNPTRTDDNDHGCHVAGTSVGNTQGWARGANIYNLSPYGSNQNGLTSNSLFDYIRAFHSSKPINPITGRKNPTIVNNSWEVVRTVSLSRITKIVYRGMEYNGPFTSSQLLNYGIIANLPFGLEMFASVLIRVRSTPLDTDIETAISEGIIFVGAVGNASSKISVLSDIDYNNTLVIDGQTTYLYMQGSSPSATSNSICVGAVSARSNESKATYSNCGPRINIYAPGSNIMSSQNSSGGGGTYDYRNADKFIAKLDGTSMGAPQVTGVLACALELYPTMNQAAAVAFIEGTAKLNQLTTTNGGYSDFTSLQGSANRYLHYVREHQDEGQIFPKQNVGFRKNVGQMYPRTRIYSYGRQTMV
jgi:hypothetical protein